MYKYTISVDWDEEDEMWHWSAAAISAPHGADGGRPAMSGFNFPSKAAARKDAEKKIKAAGGTW